MHLQFMSMIAVCVSVFQFLISKLLCFFFSSFWRNKLTLLQYYCVSFSLLFFYLMWFFGFFLIHLFFIRRLRDFLDPRNFFEDRKLNRILKDLTDALDMSHDSPTQQSFSYFLSGLNDNVKEPENVQLLNLDLVNAPGK